MDGAVTFECSVCLEDKAELKPRLIAKSPVCEKCVQESIVPLFTKAVEHEHAYPPRWGSAQLEVEDFKQYFDLHFIARYYVREVEYLSKTRLYCTHKIYVKDRPLPGGSAPEGRVLALRPVVIWNAQDHGKLSELTSCGAMVTNCGSGPPLIVTCYSCNGRLCRCGKLVYSDMDVDHICNVDRSDQDDILKDQVRGKDYQRCPKCPNIISLFDGCNHVRCDKQACRAHFCFVCGEEVDPDGDHWSETRQGQPCPRYNQPDAPNAVYDGPPEEPAQPRPEDFIRRMIFAGNRLIANGAQVNRDFIQGLLQELLGFLPGDLQLQGEDPDADARTMWEGYNDIFVRLESDRWETVANEVSRFAEGRFLDINGREMTELVGFAEHLYGSLPLLARIPDNIADDQKQFWLDEQPELIRQFTVFPVRYDIHHHFPRLVELAFDFISLLPDWLRLAPEVEAPWTD
jgi:hypothetical protein